jgi:hypothetical protein
MSSRTPWPQSFLNARSLEPPRLFLELIQVREENRKVVENYTSELTMRKKYYNMGEDMKCSYH